jgi:glycine dehydrogenase subunit 2
MSSPIFDSTKSGRSGTSLEIPADCIKDANAIDQNLLRTSDIDIPEMSELDTVRHFTKLSQENFSIDTNMYPLGSCTMKYNPKAYHAWANLPGFANAHPLLDESLQQGTMACMFELQEDLALLTGMQATCLTPMAGAQGELTGVLMIRAYHNARGDDKRTEFLVPDAAHGTNPATAAMCGFKVKSIPTKKDGDLDLDALERELSDKTAGIMLTNPSTLGTFERNILKISKMVHAVGGLLYYDGANFNAILGKACPGDMGFDVMHLNLHKTFATPHGGGGPGSGPVVCVERLAPYLPVPRVGKKIQNSAPFYHWLDKTDCPESIGRLSTFMGNVGVLLRAYMYVRQLGTLGLQRVSDHAVLNANYVMNQLQKVGYELGYSNRNASHEFVLTLQKLAKQGVTALDVAKRLLDSGYHAPTIYFPLLVPECFLIEPTETESLETLDQFIAVMKEILHESLQNPEKVLSAPSKLKYARVDEVKAAKDPKLKWTKKKLAEVEDLVLE